MLCTGVVTTASASEAPAMCPRIWSVRSSRQTTATVPSRRSARIFTVDPRTNGSGRDGHLLQQIELIQYLAGAEGDAGQRVLALRDRQVRFLAKQMIETAQQRAAAGEHDALVDDIGGQLGRRPLEARAHG